MRNTDVPEGKSLAKGIISEYNEASRQGLISPESDPEVFVGFRLSNVQPTESRHLVLPGQEVRFGTKETKRGREATWVFLVGSIKGGLMPVPAAGKRAEALILSYDATTGCGYFFVGPYEEVEVPAIAVHEGRNRGRTHLHVGCAIRCLVERQNGSLIATNIEITASAAERSRRVRA